MLGLESCMFNDEPIVHPNHEHIVQPDKKIILNKSIPVTNENTIMDIPIKILKGYGLGFSSSQVKTILSTQYLINLSKLDNETLWKVCENYNVTYPKIKEESGSSHPSLNLSYKRSYMIDELIERFKKVWKNLDSCLAPKLCQLYSKYNTKIIQHILIYPHYSEDYKFAIVYYNMCNLTHFIGEDD
jgi:hypothetical protein